MHGNAETIDKYGNTLVRRLKDIRIKLDPNTYDTNEKYTDTVKINSGFSKIYFLLIDDYIIYDGRVGNALCYLVRLFCEENNSDTNIPLKLKFAFGEGRTTDNTKNPNKNGYEFPRLYPYNHLEKNMYGNWLLKAILENTNSRFNKLDKSTQLRALEAALFMIGYSVNEEGGNKDVKPTPDGGEAMKNPPENDITKKPQAILRKHKLST